MLNRVRNSADLLDEELPVGLDVDADVVVPVQRGAVAVLRRREPAAQLVVYHCARHVPGQTAATKSSASGKVRGNTEDMLETS